MSLKNIVLSILVLAAFSTFAMAQGGTQPPNQPNQLPRERGFGRGGREFGREGFGERGPGMRRPNRIDFNRLNLTDAQKVRIQTLLENNRKSAETNKAQFEEMGRLRGLKREGLLTTEQGTRLTTLEAQMKTNGDRMRNDLLAIFTPEQKVLVEQMQNERGGRGEMRRGMQMRRERGGQNGPGRRGRPMGGGNQPPQPPPTNN
jgi:Spy/CpxP family protein refolding chaperone